MPLCKGMLLALTTKYKTKVEVVDSDKYSSLVEYGTNHNRKMFYGEGPRRNTDVTHLKKNTLEIVYLDPRPIL